MIQKQPTVLGNGNEGKCFAVMGIFHEAAPLSLLPLEVYLLIIVKKKKKKKFIIQSSGNVK